MPLLVKAMAPEGTLVVVSSMVTLAIQTLESVRTRYTICSRLPRRVRLRIGLATPSQQFVAPNSMKTTTFLTFSPLSATGMCKMSPVPAIVTLGHSRVHSSSPDCNSMTPKIK